MKKRLLDTSRQAQVQRVIDALRTGSKSTIDLQRDENIMRPAARVHDAKQRGYDITTSLQSLNDDYGRPHGRVAVYSLIAEPKRGEVQR